MSSDILIVCSWGGVVGVVVVACGRCCSAFTEVRARICGRACDTVVCVCFLVCVCVCLCVV